jgi:hypothetical protein
LLLIIYTIYDEFFGCWDGGDGHEAFLDDRCLTKVFSVEFFVCRRDLDVL